VKLAELQELFWRSVRAEPAPPEAARAFVSRGALSAFDRLAIYRTAHWVRLVAALRELFPSVVREVGDGPFARLASHHLAAHPPARPFIEGVGEDFPTFLAERSEPLAALARLDWARYCVFVAPDEVPVRAEQIDPAALPHATLTASRAVRVVEGPGGFTAVWRVGFEVHELPLGAAEACALEAAATGLSFAAWCEAIGGPPEQLSGRLHAWLARGWVGAVS